MTVSAKTKLFTNVSHNEANFGVESKVNVHTYTKKFETKMCTIFSASLTPSGNEMSMVRHTISLAGSG